MSPNWALYQRNPPERPGIVRVALTPVGLAITTQPGSATEDSPFGQQPVIRLVNAYGQAVAQAGRAVVVTKHAGVAGTLTGSTTILTDAAGVATFTTLTLDTAESGVTLDFAATGLSGITSASFTVAASGGGFNPANIVDWDFVNGTFTPSHFGTPIPAYNSDSAVTGSAGWCARSNWPSGSAGEQSPGWLWYGGSDFGGSWQTLSDIWIRWAVKFFGDYTGAGATGQKINRIYDSAGDVYVSSLGRAGSGGFIYDFGDTGFQPGLSNIPAPGTAGWVYGTWHWLEIRFRRSGSHWVVDIYFDGETDPRHTFTDPATSSGTFGGYYECFTTLNGPFDPYEFRVDRPAWSTDGRIGLPVGAKIGT